MWRVCGPIRGVTGARWGGWVAVVVSSALDILGGAGKGGAADVDACSMESKATISPVLKSVRSDKSKPRGPTLLLGGALEVTVFSSALDRSVVLRCVFFLPNNFPGINFQPPAVREPSSTFPEDLWNPAFERALPPAPLVVKFMVDWLRFLHANPGTLLGSERTLCLSKLPLALLELRLLIVEVSHDVAEPALLGIDEDVPTPTAPRPSLPVCK